MAVVAGRQVVWVGICNKEEDFVATLRYPWPLAAEALASKACQRS